MKRILSLAFLLLSAVILLSISFSIDSSGAADSAKITVAYSGSVLGYLEPCG